MNPIVERLMKPVVPVEPPNLGRSGAVGSMDLDGPTGLQLPLELLGSPITPCQPSTRLGRWSGEQPKAADSSSVLNPTYLASYICMASWSLVIGFFLDKRLPISGPIFSRRSDAHKCSRCGKVVVQAITSPSTSPKNSASSSSSEVDPC